jgi:hypothetical protein
VDDHIGAGEHGILGKRGDFKFETDRLEIKKGPTARPKRAARRAPSSPGVAAMASKRA